MAVVSSVGMHVVHCDDNPHCMSVFRSGCAKSVLRASLVEHGWLVTGAGASDRWRVICPNHKPPAIGGVTLPPRRNW